MPSFLWVYSSSDPETLALDRMRFGFTECRWTTWPRKESNSYPNSGAPKARQDRQACLNPYAEVRYIHTNREGTNFRIAVNPSTWNLVPARGELFKRALFQKRGCDNRTDKMTPLVINGSARNATKSACVLENFEDKHTRECCSSCYRIGLVARKCKSTEFSINKCKNTSLDRRRVSSKRVRKDFGKLATDKRRPGNRKD